MRLGRPLLQLPIRFCVETLAAEVRALGEDAWLPHPQGFAGNHSVPLVSPGGEIGDAHAGPMAPTEHLLRSPYIRQAMAALGSNIGRSRLMALDPEAEVPMHVDVNYYWRTHLRIHIPVITNPDVEFTSGDMTVRMAPGECWLLDSFFRHQVRNRGGERRIHLVIDTVGSARLWDLLDASERGLESQVVLAPSEKAMNSLDYEQFNWPKVMSPWEIRCHIDYLREWTEPSPQLDRAMRQMDRFVMAWTGAWARFGTSDEGQPTYRAIIDEARAALARTGSEGVRMRNAWLLYKAVNTFIFSNALAQPKVVEAIAAGDALDAHVPA